MMLTDLPASLQLNIMQRLSDGRDLVSLGQVCPELGLLTEDRLLWKKLCQYHFTDRQAWWNPLFFLFFFFQPDLKKCLLPSSRPGCCCCAVQCALADWQFAYLSQIVEL